jgi:UDP-glucose 4-epimerase
MSKGKPSMNVRNCRVVVTGGAGFIGSHLTDQLLSAGNEVSVVDDFSTGHERNLAQHLDNPRLHINRVDVRDEAALSAAAQGAAFFFHLATRNVRLSIRQPTLVHDVNTNGTLVALKAAAACGVRRFLYCSSSEVNGTADRVPMPEDYVYRPETIYGASKLAGEYYTNVFHRSGWLETVIARPHNNYGPREHHEGICGEVIPRFILQALAGEPLTVYADGGQTRDFTYVTETAEYLVRLAENPVAAGGTFNVCRGEEVSIRTVAHLILELTGSKSLIKTMPARPSDVRRLCGDHTRLRQLLGSAPKINIRDGLALTVEWFRRHVAATEVGTLAASNWSNTAAEAWLENVEKRALDKAG